MRRRVLFACVVLILFCVLVSVVWTLLGWPPPRLVLKYGIPPYCEPTGRVAVIEGIDFVEIGPGCFGMGSTESAKGGDTLGKLCSKLGLPWGNQPKPSDEMPVHWVEFERGFWIARTEVTNEEYERMGFSHSRYRWARGDRYPVEHVSWNEAVDYCSRLSATCGFGIRLPSEAMWEAACRGGSASAFSFGGGEARLAEYAWYEANSGPQPHQVGTRRGNDWGLFDLHGNVSEWCEDTYHDTYANAPTDGSAWTEGGWRLQGSPIRVVRGGNWSETATNCRSASRFWTPPDFTDWYHGFRVAFSLAREQEHLVRPYLVNRQVPARPEEK